MDSPRLYAKWKKSDTKDYILYDSIYINFKKRQNYSVGKQISVAWIKRGPEEGDWLQRDTREFFLKWWKHLFIDCGMGYLTVYIWVTVWMNTSFEGKQSLSNPLDRLRSPESQGQHRPCWELTQMPDQDLFRVLCFSPSKDRVRGSILRLSVMRKQSPMEIHLKREPCGKETDTRVLDYK